jgi:hypothetical protein
VGIKELETLTLWSAEIKDAEALTKALNLRTLMLFDTAVDTEFLGGMSQIRELRLSGFDGTAISGLGHLHELKSLTIIGGNLGDIRWLPGLESLENLDLYSVAISESAAFPTLPKLKKLKLNLKGTAVATELAKELRRKFAGAKVTTT